MLKKQNPPSSHPLKLVSVATGHSIQISLTNQLGRRYHYRAQSVSLNMEKSGLQVIEANGGCFVWFDHCDLELRSGRRTLSFHLNAGAVSNLPDAGMVILADLVPAISTENHTPGMLPSGKLVPQPPPFHRENIAPKHENDIPRVASTFFGRDC